MRKLSVQLPDDVYSRLVRAAREQDLTLDDYVEEALSQVLDLEDGDDEEGGYDDEDLYDKDDDEDDEDYYGEDDEEDEED